MGTVFVYRPDGAEHYYIGIVVEKNISAGGFANGICIVPLDMALDEIPSQFKEEQLKNIKALSPVTLGPGMWTQGYFQNIGQISDKILSRFWNKDETCFFSSSIKKYFDCYGKVLSGKRKVCGEFSLTTNTGFEKTMKKTFGIM